MSDDEKLRFITEEDEEVFIDGFVLEQSADVVMTGYELEETEDETIARHLLKARRLWKGSPEPHLILPPARSRHGGLPPYVITAWLRSAGQKIVVVVFVDVYRDKTIEEVFDIYLHQIHFKALAGVDQEEERKMFDWYNRN